jgi:hypothetical protein
MRDPAVGVEQFSYENVPRSSSAQVTPNVAEYGNAWNLLFSHTFKD